MGRTILRRCCRRGPRCTKTPFLKIYLIIFGQRTTRICTLERNGTSVFKTAPSGMRSSGSRLIFSGSWTGLESSLRSSTNRVLRRSCAPPLAAASRRRDNAKAFICCLFATPAEPFRRSHDRIRNYWTSYSMINLQIPRELTPSLSRMELAWCSVNLYMNI